MNFSTWAIKNPTPPILLFILLTFIGLISFQRLPIQKFPDMDLPTVQISASLEGAAPEQLETEVARKIEDKLVSLTLLDHITTTINDGSVNINVSFTLDKDLNEALNEVRNAVDSAQPDLPSDMNDPVVSKMTDSGKMLLTYQVQSQNLDPQERSWFIDNDLSKALLSVPGVSTISRVSGVNREILIELNTEVMESLGISALEISNRFKSIQKDYSGGKGDIGGAQQSFRILGAIDTIDEIRNMEISLTDGRVIALGQIASISDTHEDLSSLAYVDLEAVVGFEVTRSRGFSDVGVAEAIRTTIEEFSSNYPNITITEVANGVDAILDNYQSSMQLLYEGALLAIIVVWFFLKDMRATIISASALPLSVIPIFAVMYFCGYSLNTITLLALSLVVGILVDDAIVEVENIERHLMMGKKPFAAAMEAADEIGLAVISTTLTLVAVFIPTAFMGGIPGLIFRQFGITASVAVLASLLVARLLTPMMAAYLLKPSPNHVEHPDSTLMTHYLQWVRAAIDYRKRTMTIALTIFIGSLTLIPFLSISFMPPSDEGQTQVSIELVPGSSLVQTEAVTLEAIQILKRIPEVSTVFSVIGSKASGAMSGSNTNAVNSATLTVNLVSRNDRSKRQSDVEQSIRAALQVIPGIRLSVGSGMNGTTLEVTLASDDPELLTRTASQLEKELQGLSGVGNITSSASLQRPEITIKPDYTKAAALGVTSQTIAETIRLATYGDYSSALSKMNLPQRQLAIRVQLDKNVRSDIEAIRHLKMPGKAGLVDLASIASVNLESGPSQIDRIDRKRNVTFSIELNNRIISDVMREVSALPTMQSLPANVSLVEQGELQRMNEMMSSFGLAMIIGIFCVFAILVLLFKDFLQPLTILSALPLSLGGALLALILGQMNFSLASIIGILMLMGIVTKNSILLVEYAIRARNNFDMNRTEALIDACHKRARPIIMTTIAMIAGMLPIAMGFGADPSFRQPMAFVVIGGLLASTGLSLLIVPVIFTYIDDLTHWIKKWFPEGDLQK